MTDPQRITIRTTRDRAECMLHGLQYLRDSHDSNASTTTGFTRYAHRQCRRQIDDVIADMRVALDLPQEEKSAS